MFRKVPKGTNWFYTLGSATMFAFLSQAVTGVFLAMYYRPDPSGGAYESIRYVTNEVFLGQFVRGMHKWGSSVMVVLVFLHMGRTFFFGAYKYPRELNWVIGVVLLILTMVMSFTGYLLPFDQRAYWATIVGVNINGTGPLVGPYLSDFLRGGAEFGATTLSRFYAIHMLLVPGLLAALIGAHLYLVAKLGTTAPPWTKARRAQSCARQRYRARASQPASALRRGRRMNQREKEEYLREYGILKSQGKPFFPYAVAKDGAMACVVMAVIIAMSLVLGAELGLQGEPHDDHLRAAAGVVLLLPVRGAARDQAAEPRAAGDDRHTDDLHDRAVPAAVLRPRPRASPRAAPDRDVTGIAVIGAMAFLTYEGANTGSPTAIEFATPAAVVQASGKQLAEYEAGKEVVARSGCLGCHKIGDNGNAGPGPNLTNIASRIPRQAIARTLVNPTAPMPSFKNLPAKEFEAVVNFLSQLK